MSSTENIKRLISIKKRQEDLIVRLMSNEKRMSELVNELEFDNPTNVQHVIKCIALVSERLIIQEEVDELRGEFECLRLLDECGLDFPTDS